MNKYITNSENKIEINQESMDKRIEELYIKEIEKDVKDKVEKQGFKVLQCNVKGKINQNKEETGITKIKLKVEKSNENNSSDIDEYIENKMISDIQKI